MIATLKDLELEYWLRKRNNGTLIWKTKSGAYIPLKDMTNEHLVNTIRMLNRNEDLQELACEYEAYINDLD